MRPEKRTFIFAMGLLAHVSMMLRPVQVHAQDTKVGSYFIGLEDAESGSSRGRHGMINLRGGNNASDVDGILDASEVIYGKDDRVEVNSELEPRYLEFAESVLAMVENEDLNLDPASANYTVSVRKFSDMVCADERFSEQKMAARCTGFVVGEDLLLTAGHCIRTEGDCHNNSWVLDYRVDTLNFSEDKKVEVPSSKVFTCKKILERSLSYDISHADFALVQLDRPVGRRALPVRSAEDKRKMELDDKLFIIGHPTGLPMKFLDGIVIRKNTEPNYFTVEADTYGGNSGSPVINAADGVVEGILVRGERDYVYDSEAGCMRSNICETGTCRGEDVSRVASVTTLKDGKYVPKKVVARKPKPPVPRIDRPCRRKPKSSAVEASVITETEVDNTACDV